MMLLLLLALQTSYDAGLIPDSLKTGAHAVVRESQESLVISSLSKATLKVHRVVTILDERGRSQGDMLFAAYSYSFLKLDDADIYVYDAKGNPIQHVRRKQMEESGYGEGLVEDGMYTYFSVTAPSYPITVEMDYSETYKGMTTYPNFILDNIYRSFQDAAFTLTLPESMAIRYQNHQINLSPQVSDEGGNRTYAWKVTGLRAIREETGALSSAYPWVYIGPTRFELDGYEGDLSTWTSFGKWIYDLNKPTYDLPDASKQFYRDMVRGASTDLDKARILYHYLQDNFRYVSIQLGIGGLRSFPATFTEQKKYGDCKALSTYMMACLNAVGVKCYTAIINAGYGGLPIDPTFPRNGFNHMIVCIPRAGDSVWLECTSKHTDFGVLGGFTENRNALLITENGGALVHTPRSTPAENTTRSFTRISLKEDGSGVAEIARATSGEAKFAERSSLGEADRDAQKRYLVDVLDLPQPGTFEVHMGAADSSLLRTSILLSYDKIPPFTAGTKMFLNPHLNHIWRGQLPAAEHCTEDYYFTYPFQTLDTNAYGLPAGYVVEEFPKDKSLSCPYATYTSRYWYDSTSRTVYCAEALVLKTRRIPAADYGEVRHFFAGVTEDETEKIVAEKPGTP